MLANKALGLRRPLAALSGLVIFFILISLAAAAPVPPYALYGDATINGRAVPEGSVITAEIDGVSKGSVTLWEDGIYGGMTGEENKLMVRNGQDGQEIVFYVQTPQMANRIQAAETATYQAGGVDELDLTFTGEEIPKSSGDDSGSSSSGDSGSSGASGQDQPDETGQGVVYDLDLSGYEPREVELGNKDTVNILIDGDSYSILLKSMSDFSVLLEYQGESIVLGIGESKEIDLNGDYVTDIVISLDNLEEGKAFMTFTGLEKDAVEAGVEGITGYATANPVVPSVLAIIVIAAIGGSVYKFRRRGSI